MRFTEEAISVYKGTEVTFGLRRTLAEMTVAVEKKKSVIKIIVKPVDCSFRSESKITTRG